MSKILFEPGKKIVLRENGKESTVIVEDLITDEEGNKLLVRDLGSHSRRVINPTDHTIVEHLED